MSKKKLNDEGLLTLWNRMKSFVDQRLAALDTLLEKKINKTDAVDLTSDQVISGTKNFYSGINLGEASFTYNAGDGTLTLSFTGSDALSIVFNSDGSITATEFIEE